MFTFQDLMARAQSGAAVDDLARAYGMNPTQMRAAMAALAPAFAQGFQRQARDEDAARRLHDLMGAEAYARAFEAQAAALDPSTKAAGDDALGALFGSKEVSRAVAAQAAAASGVQAEIIRKVLPVLTSILIGGFMKATQGGTGAKPEPQAAPFPGPFGEFWGQILGGAARADTKADPDAGPPNPFGEWMGGYAKPGPEKEREPTPNPLGDAMGEMLDAMFGGVKRAEAPETPKSEPEQPKAASPFDQFVDSGRELQAHNARAMEQIFDAFFGGKGPAR